MLKRYFIPLILLLATLAVVVYFLTGATQRTHDVRAAVPVEKFQLSNGLQVVVLPSARIPVVTHMLVVKTGGADDPQGKTGLAHYLEHLMFTGTKNFPEGVYERAIARVGGAQNASTLYDYTVYYATVPAKQLSHVMAMEADRLANLDFAADKAARELKVITEERGIRVENSPVAQWREQMDAITFLNHPYRQPLIGWAEDMATFTPQDARAFFDTHYRPGNMVLVVAGDVSAREVRRYAQRYYGGLPAGEIAVRNWPTEPPVRLTRRGEMRDARVNEPRLMRQYVAPSVKSGNAAQALPLAVFAHYLGGGDTSVLYESLVRQQKLAVSVSASYNAVQAGPGLFRIGAIPAPGVSVKQLEEALDRALVTVLAAPLDAAGINRAKTLLKAEVIYAQDGVQPLANTMAGLFAIGLDEQFFYEWAESIAAVTDVQALEAARAVLVSSRGVTGYLLPEGAAMPVMEAAHE